MGLAQELWTARKLGSQVIVAEGKRPATDADAYALQRAVSESADAKVVGWKLGATAQAALDLLGFSEPFFGPLYSSYFHHSGDTVPIVAAHGAGIETEFVVGMGVDLPPRDAPYTQADVAAATEWISPGFEVIGTRLEGGLAGKGNLLIADGGANMDFVQGLPVSDWRQIDLTHHPATLYINGKLIASGHSGMLMFGHTLGAVAWLANHVALKDRGIRAGDVITTGTCTGVNPIAPGDEAHADFGALGEVRARFVAA